MQPLRRTYKLSGDRKVTVHVPDDFGYEVEIIIFRADDKDFKASTELAKLQEINGFARDVLGSPDEDVWNEL